MSSNIEVQRICQHCGKVFTARTTSTMYCSHKCNSQAYKARVKAEKVEVSNTETHRLKSKPIEDLKAKEFLTVRDCATLLNISVRSVYYYIDSGKIKAVNLAQRITRVKRSEIDKLFEQPRPVMPPPQTSPSPLQFELFASEINDYYTITEILSKFKISEKALHDVIKRNRVPKIKKGRFAYVPKNLIDKLLS